MGKENRKWKFLGLGLITILFSIQVLFIVNEPWVADYWEHRAVLYELYRNPFNPNHPIVNEKIPHAFFSPYMVGLALSAKMLSISPSEMLNLAALVNLSLFFVAVWLLVRLFLRKYDKFKSFFLLLIIMLFFWGIFPPYYSSFYHFISLPYVITYPSTFAFSVSIFSAYMYSRLLRTGFQIFKNCILLLAILFLNWLILLTHPLSYLFCFSLYIYLFLYEVISIRKGIVEKKIVSSFSLYSILTIVALFLPFCLIYFWTYFPVYDLLVNVPLKSRFHTDSEVLYSSLFKSYFPFIFPVVLLINGMAKNVRKLFPILSAIIFLFGLYLYGYFANAYGFGRVISFIAIFFQLWLLSSVLDMQSIRKRKMAVVVVALLISPFVLLSSKIIFSTAVISHSEYLQKKTANPFEQTMPTTSIIHRLLFINSILKNGVLVLADPVSNRYIPGMGGKVIASSYADYWITDNASRLKEVNDFFYGMDSQKRIYLLEKYKPSYLLFTPSTKHLIPELRPYFEESGSVSANGIYLIKLCYN